MRIPGEFDYRNARGILRSQRELVLTEILSLLNDVNFHLRLGAAPGKMQDLSNQIQKHFVSHGWQKERDVFTLPDLRYDLVKEDVPIEIEIGHARLVYADFLKFLVDYSQEKIPAGVMVVAENPKEFGHKWPNSRENTTRKIQAIRTVLLVPILVLGVQP